MVDASLSAIAEFDNHVPVTIDEVDSMLYHWDIDGDRQRILQFLARLLGPDGETTFDFSKLKSFGHRMRESQGDTLGWYVVSLLLTGERELCRATFELLPYDGVQRVSISIFPNSRLMDLPFCTYAERSSDISFHIDLVHLRCCCRVFGLYLLITGTSWRIRS